MKEIRGIEIEILSEASFERFGKIIEPNKKNLFIQYEDGSAFHVLAKSKSNGWRVAVLKLRTRTIIELQVHRSTMETFEPLKGTAIVCVNTTPSLEGLKAFILDRPILLYTNIWHNVLTISEESLIKITENDEVDSEEIKIQGLISPILHY